MNNKICNVQGCNNKHHAKGLCNKHRQRLSNTGKLDNFCDLSIVDKFESRFTKSQKLHPRLGTPCWIWNAGKCSYGYGHFVDNKITHKAHRYSYQLYKGTIPDGMLIRHRCDNPSCVNPDHLLLGTIQDNVDDRVRRNRSNTQRGELRHNAVFKTHDVMKIISDLDKGITCKELSNQFKVPHQTISDINCGKTWNWLTNRRK